LLQLLRLQLYLSTPPPALPPPPNWNPFSRTAPFQLPTRVNGALCISHLALLVYLGIREFVHLYLWLRSTYLVRRYFDFWGEGEQAEGQAIKCHLQALGTQFEIINWEVMYICDSIKK